MTNKTGPFFQLYDKNIQLQKSITSFLLEAATAGAPLHDLLHGTQIFANDLTQPEGRCHHRDWLTLLERCQPFISPTLPFAAADNLLHNPDHSLCQSLLRAPDLARSLRQLFYFRHQLMPSIFVLVRKSHTRISIIVKAALPLHAQQPLVLHLVMAFLIQLIQLTTGQAAALSLQLKAPPRAQNVAAWPCKTQFSQPLDALHIPLHLWQQPLAQQDATEFRALTRACYQLNQSLPKHRGIWELIQRQQVKALPGTLTLQQAAVKLGLSPSSLKRLLQLQHTHFAALLDDIRCDLAGFLLQQQHSNRQLASQLGYSDEHNFRRAFKRWTGNVPSSLRLPVS